MDPQSGHTRRTPDNHRQRAPAGEDAGGDAPAPRVLIIHGQPLVREGLRHVLERDGRLRVADGDDALSDPAGSIRRLRPSVVILEVSPARGRGLVLVEQLVEDFPDVALLVLSRDDNAFLAERCIRAGARGCLLASEGPAEVLQAVRAVLEGGLHVGNDLARRVVRRIAGQKDAEIDGLERLSNREFQVFSLIGHGLGTREIAAQLDVSPKTVHAHRSNIKKKLNLESGNELLRCAMRWSRYEQP